ncbi:MHO_1590 family protein [Mycoplasmopsis columbina]|uniref:MHO_1590 family protein n=1 Tax=Mycoplasmopsis columbina TaxID=114881 RepID=UPI0004A6FEC8|nr:hypothetical protein [Mycoplasmopsis columbina]VEU76627.1 membrane protein [Mycoplasmopsis columbina]
MKKRKKIFLSIGAIGAICAITIPLAMISQKKTKDDKLTKIDSLKTFDNIFPTLNEKNYYKYIRIENEKPVFDINVIPKLIKDIVANFQIGEGELYFDYEIVTNSTIKLYLKWIEDKNEISAIYNLSTSFDGITIEKA